MENSSKSRSLFFFQGNFYENERTCGITKHTCVKPED